MTVAQLVERSLPTPEIQGSQPIISNCIYYQPYRKDKNQQEKVERHRSKESKENVSNDKCSTHQMIYSCSIYCHISEKVPQNAAVQRSPSMMGFSDYLLERKQCTKADSKGILMLNNQEMFQDKILLVSSSDSPNSLNFRIVPIISQIYVTLLVFFSKNHFTLELLGKYKNN